MMCKCCDGNKHCKCMCHKMKGVGVIVLGLYWFVYNYGWVSSDSWKWVLPLAVVLCGLKKMMMANHCGSSCKSCATGQPMMEEKKQQCFTTV